MALIEINWNPTSRQLRQFAGIGLIALPSAGYVWGGSWPAIGMLAALGSGLALAGYLRPAVVRPFFLALSLVTIPIGFVVGELALALIYFLLLLPIGLVFRLMGRDALSRRRDLAARSYWREKQQPKSSASYYRQF
ncbi:MAG: hypothetical protein ACKPEY_04200 [Planctomycetota bacterium]